MAAASASIVVLAVVWLLLGAGVASAQQPPIVPADGIGAPSPTSEGPIPVLTVADATVERCEALAVAGSAFAPDATMSIAVNGTAEEDRPFTDGDGSFTFTTTVACEQASGFVQIRAFDGTTTIAIDVAVGAAPPPIATASSSAGAPSRTDRVGDLVLPSLRLLLAAVLAAELIVLWRLRQRRRARRARTLAEPTPT